MLPEDIFPFHACDYARSLAEKSPAFRRQIEPDMHELDDDESLSEDPFGEDDEDGGSSGCHGLKQRFPDRVLVVASDSCFANCRHCTRRNLLGRIEVVRSDEELAACVDYVKSRPEIRDVLVSGGDPLVLPDEEVMRFVNAFASLDQVDIVRVCTRAPCSNPLRVTRRLANLLGQSGKVWVNTQFNHASELTPEAREACRFLVRAGIPVSCQTVLLAGVNDDAETLLELFRALQRARVRPYYVFQCDPVKGTSHFRVPLEKAQEIARVCAERIGGLGLPRFVADIPGSRSKVPLELVQQR